MHNRDSHALSLSLLSLSHSLSLSTPLTRSLSLSQVLCISLSLFLSHSLLVPLSLSLTVPAHSPWLHFLSERDAVDCTLTNILLSAPVLLSAGRPLAVCSRRPSRLINLWGGLRVEHRIVA